MIQPIQPIAAFFRPGWKRLRERIAFAVRPKPDSITTRPRQLLPGQWIDQELQCETFAPYDHRGQSIPSDRTGTVVDLRTAAPAFGRRRA